MNPQAWPLPSWAAPYLPEFEAMLRMVELAGGFVLQPLDVPGPDLARILAAWLAAHGHPTVVTEPHDDHAWKELSGWLLDDVKPPHDGVVLVLGSRDPPDGVFLALRLMNERRDAIAARLGCPLFWCGPQRFLALTAEWAPDFWSVRAVERRLKLAAENAPPAPQAALKSAPPNLLAEARRQGDARSVLTLSLQQARQALAQGKLDEVDTLLSATASTDWEARLLLAEVARQRGTLDAALAWLAPPEGNALDPSMEPRIAFSRGRVQETAGHAHAADEHYQAAQRLAEHAKDRSLATWAAIRRSAIGFQNDPDQALSTLQRAQDQAREQGDLALTALACAVRAHITARLHDRAGAHRFLEEARALARQAEGHPTVLMPRDVEEALVSADDPLTSRPDERADVPPSNVDKAPARTSPPRALSSAASPPASKTAAAACPPQSPLPPPSLPIGLPASPPASQAPPFEGVKGARDVGILLTASQPRRQATGALVAVLIALSMGLVGMGLVGARRLFSGASHSFSQPEVSPTGSPQVSTLPDPAWNDASVTPLPMGWCFVDASEHILCAPSLGACESLRDEEAHAQDAAPLSRCQKVRYVHRHAVP